MKKAIKIIVTILSIFVVGAAGFLTYLKTAYPKIAPPQEIKIESTPQLIARGSYLANHVCLCVDCHSQRDWTKYCAPLMKGTIGQGGETFDQKFGFPGSILLKKYYSLSFGKLD